MKSVTIFFMMMFFWLNLSGLLDVTHSEGKVRRLILSNSDKTIYQTVSIAIGEVLVITFPSGVKLSGLPVIGDSSLIRVEIEASPLRMRIWGMVFQGSSEQSMVGVSSNMQFTLTSGQSFIFKMQIAEVSQSLSRVEISHPDWEKSDATARSQISEYKKEVDRELKKKFENLDAEADNRLKDVLAKSFAEFFQCNNYSVRTENKLVFFSSDRICKMGEDGFIVVNFRIKNRGRKRFHVAEVKIYALREGSRVEVDIPTIFLQKFSMLFDEVVSGGISFKIAADEYAERYELELKESAGKQRILKIPVSF